MRILIVDDNETNRKLLRVTLEAENQEVLEATDGVEALSIVEKEPIDAVISDILMPRMDGYRFCSELRRQARYDSIVFLIHTNTYLSPTDEKLAFQVGADAFLEKPATARRILDEIQRVQSTEITRQRRQQMPDPQVMKEYNEVLITKLEKKNLELQQSRSELAEQNRLLQESESRYRLLFEVNPLPMWVYDLETLAFLAVNQAAIQSYGWTKDEFLSMTIKDIRPPEEISALVQNISGTRTGAASSGPWRHRKKDGSIILVEIISHELEFSGRRSRLVLAEDITRRVLVEQSLKTSEEEKLFLQKQLLQAQKIEAIGQLAGGVAHDFNNTLMAIDGYAELLLFKLAEDDPLRKIAQDIVQGVKQGSDLTRQLLAFSRKQVLTPVVLDLNQSINKIEDMLRRLIGENIQLRTSLENNLGSVKADPGQVDQVLLNLAVNARDAMPDGGKLFIETHNVHLDEDYVKLHVYVTPGNYVLLSVSDTGIGMDEEILSRIFEPFFTTKEEGKGTGLGLSTVFGIIKQSDGYVSVYSQPGKGTTFKIYLPRIDQPAERTPPKVSSPSLGHGETILLVDDNESIRVAFGSILRLKGYNVIQAENGHKALEAAEKYQQKIHLLVTDMVMPEMSGKELAVRLREKRPDIKALYMSGYTEEAIRAQGQLEDHGAFISKPASIQSLLEKIRELLD